jgi:hypothetical protein
MQERVAAAARDRGSWEGDEIGTTCEPYMPAWEKV